MRHPADRAPAEQALEIVTPRTNAARLSPAEHLLAALVLPGPAQGEPVALEIAADAEQRRFLVRTGSADEQQRVASLLGAAYPQAALRPCTPVPTGDPAVLGPDEQAAMAVLRLRAGEHLPLRTFDDRDLDPETGSAEADPLLGVLGALLDLPPAWRAVAQLVVLGPGTGQLGT